MQPQKHQFYRPHGSKRHTGVYSKVQKSFIQGNFIIWRTTKSAYITEVSIVVLKITHTELKRERKPRHQTCSVKTAGPTEVQVILLKKAKKLGGQ